VGKHSSRGGQDDRDNRIPGPGDFLGGPGRPVPAGSPGTGRRRRGPGGTVGGYGDELDDGFGDAFGDGFGGDPYRDSGGFPVVRPPDLAGPPQTHPEHREHGAWGGAGGWPRDGGSRYGTAPYPRELTFDPVEEWAEDWAEHDEASARRASLGGMIGVGALGTGAGAGTQGGPHSRQQPQVSGPRMIPRPRQEFVDAFADPPVESPGAPGKEAEPPATAAQTAVSAGGAGGKPAGAKPAGAKPVSGKARPGRGRAISGVAAAAVVTVLAVVAVGQLAGGKKHDDPDSKDPAGRSTADESGRTTAPAPPPAGTPVVSTPAVTATAATYDQLMDRQYPLGADLALSGAFHTVPGHQPAPGHGKVMRFRVDVEQGLPLDTGLFTETVFKTLNDSRSWGHGGTMTFERVSSGPADIVVTLASPGTTAKWCAKSGLDTTVDNVSCDAASTPRTMINAYRWAQGATTFGPGRMHEYRQMLINHEVGHRLGHNHVGCPKAGAPAPVMMQQTKFLSLDGGPTCKPNAWPFP
jgi:hypothetical protein